MDPPFTEADLLDIARGMAYDTATLMEDVSRRVDVRAATMYLNLASALRHAADQIPHDAHASANTSAGRKQASEASPPGAVQPHD